MLAQRSKALIGAYRRGDLITATCPLAHALNGEMSRPT